MKFYMFYTYLCWGSIKNIEFIKIICVKKIGLCVAGSTNVLAEKLNMTLPIETHLLQACVSEPVKPVLDGVVTFGAGHFYISQSDKGEMVMGGDLDGYNSYAQRGNLPTLQHVLTEGVAMLPFLSKLKKNYRFHATFQHEKAVKFKSVKNVNI